MDKVVEINGRSYTLLRAQMGAWLHIYIRHYNRLLRLEEGLGELPDSLEKLEALERESEEIFLRKVFPRVVKGFSAANFPPEDFHPLLNALMDFVQELAREAQNFRTASPTPR